jgi:hypothetical protein
VGIRTSECSGVLAPDRLAGPGVVEGPSALRWVWADPSRDRRGSCSGEDPTVIVVVTVPSSEGTVLIDDRWQTLTGVGLAAARRAGSPS